MGRPKLLLPWGTTSVLGHLIKQWKSLQAKQIAVVCASDSSDLLPSASRALQADLRHLRFPARNRIPNPTPDRGMVSSIQCAALWPGWQPEITHWAIVLGDQPHLCRGTLQKLLDFSGAHGDSICQPSRNGHGRHPVILPKASFRKLASSQAETLKEFLTARRRSVIYLESDDAGLDLDIDRPADYKRAMRLAERQARKKLQ